MTALYLFTLGVVGTISGAFMLYGHRLAPLGSKQWLRFAYFGGLLFIAVALYSLVMFMYAAQNSATWPGSTVQELQVVTGTICVVFGLAGLLVLVLVERGPWVDQAQSANEEGGNTLPR